MSHRSAWQRTRVLRSALAVVAISPLVPSALAQVAPSMRAPIPGMQYSPRLGVSFQLVPYGRAFGALLTENAPGWSPLGQPQIQLEQGDTITHLDGVPITHAGELETHHSRTTVTFVNIRTGRPQVSFADLPPLNDPGPGPIPNPGGPYLLGVNAVPVDLNLGSAAAGATGSSPSPYPYPLPRPGTTRGLRVVTITPGSAADRAGVRVGDTLLTAGRSALTDIQALRQAIGESGGVLPLTVVDPYMNTRSITAYLGGGTLAAPAR